MDYYGLSIIVCILLLAGLSFHIRNDLLGFLWILLCFKKTNNYETDISQLNEPWKVQAYMNYYFKYIRDEIPEDEWKTPKKTWDDGYGDCEDHALFSNECLKYDYDTYIFCVYTKNTGHATCLIKIKNKWITIGTYGYKEYNHKSYDKLAMEFFDDWIVYTIYDKNMNHVETIVGGVI